jgi:hypothetical protein
MGFPPVIANASHLLIKRGLRDLIHSSSLRLAINESPFGSPYKNAVSYSSRTSRKTGSFTVLSGATGGTGLEPSLGPCSIFVGR